MNENWKKRVNQGKGAPNIKYFIYCSNRISYWIQNVILKAKDLKERNKILQKYILITKYLKEISNINSISMINGAFNSTSIYRLKKLWNKIPKKSMKIREEISKLCSPQNSHSNMRILLKSNIENKIATVPSIMLSLQDISLIYDGHKLKVFDNNHQHENGECVWAKYLDYPWWPAHTNVITNDTTTITVKWFGQFQTFKTYEQYFQSNTHKF